VPFFEHHVNGNFVEYKLKYICFRYLHSDMCNYKGQILEKYVILVPVRLSTITDINYRGADKSLARPERKQATVTEDFDFHISYL